MKLFALRLRVNTCIRYPCERMQRSVRRWLPPEGRAISRFTTQDGPSLRIILHYPPTSAQSYVSLPDSRVRLSKRSGARDLSDLLEGYYGFPITALRPIGVHGTNDGLFCFVYSFEDDLSAESLLSTCVACVSPFGLRTGTRVPSPPD